MPLNLIDSETRALPRSTDAFAHYRIGEMDVALRSEFDEAREDFASLYQHCRYEGDEPADPIRIEIRRGRRSLLGRRRHVIYGDGKPLWTARRANEVLPYVEWGINWRVIARRRDYLQLHAAALTRAGDGVVFAARSGAGKSTLAAGLLSRGWRYLSDEFALIDPEHLHVHTFPKALCIKHGSFDVIDRLGLPLWRHRHYVKVLKGRVGYLRPHDLGTDVVGEASPVRCVVFPRYVEGGGPEVRSLNRAEAAFALTELAFNRRDFGHRTVSIVSDLVRGARCVALEYGSIDEASELLEFVL